MTHFLFEDFWQNSLQRQVTTVEKFFQLKTADAIDQKSERREILP
jgi:hypothetical protein